MSGFFGGFLKGTILGVAGLAIVSAYTGRQSTAPVPDSVILDVPAGSGFDLSRADTPVVAPPAVDPPRVPGAPVELAPLGDSVRAPDITVEPAPTAPDLTTNAPAAPMGDDTVVADIPMPATTETAPSRPAQDQRAPVASDTEAVIPNIDATAPQAPTVVPAPPKADEPPKASVFETEAPKTFASGADQSNLPKVGDAPANPALTTDAGRAIDIYAAPTVDTLDKPMLSFVVIVDGETQLDPDLIEALPFPVAFALDPAHPFAKDNLRILRQLNKEVIALAALPDQATAQDTEITLAATLEMLPSTVAVMEKTPAALQTSRDANAHVPVVLDRSGHGLLAYEDGLTAILREAAKAEVPALPIYKDLDGEGQDDRTIRRFLDGAVMRASNAGVIGAVVVARLRPDTISSLLMWGFQDRAARVAIAPVSQLLRSTE